MPGTIAAPETLYDSLVCPLSLHSLLVRDLKKSIVWRVTQNAMKRKGEAEGREARGNATLGSVAWRCPQSREIQKQ